MNRRDADSSIDHHTAARIDSGLAGTTAPDRTQGAEARVAPGEGQDARPGGPPKVGEVRSAAYTEGWQGEVYRWLAKRIDRLARKLRYPSTRRGVRMWLEDVADALVWKAIRRGWK